MQITAITKIIKNIIICKILKNPRSFVFLNNSKSCPAIALKPDVEPVGDNSKPMMVAIDAIVIKMMTAQSIILCIFYFINIDPLLVPIRLAPALIIFIISS